MSAFSKYLQQKSCIQYTVKTIEAFCVAAQVERRGVGNNFSLAYQIKYISTDIDLLKKFQQFEKYQDDLKTEQNRCFASAQVKNNQLYIKIAIAMNTIINALKSDTPSQKEDFKRGINAALEYLEAQKKQLEQLESTQRVTKFTELSKKRTHSSTSFFKPSKSPSPKRARTSKPAPATIKK